MRADEVVDPHEVPAHPRILSLDTVEDPAAGGKALGLARLARSGARVPRGFVILGARPGALPDGLAEAYRALGAGPVAVRSSAEGEDGAEASFAGQYETVLGVEGGDALRLAVERCLASLEGERARSYREGRAGENGRGRAMGVVVQRMVEARAAGVLFTADPLTSAREQVVVDAVAGLGEALVSGRASPDQFVLSREGRIVRRVVSGADPVVSDEELGTMTAEALRAESAFGRPLDLEWAVDLSGELYWLQARPITTLDDDDLAELEGSRSETDVYTRANIGEMMPGPVNPLTMTSTFWAVDQGMQEMQARFGGLDRRRPGYRMSTSFHGHLYINLSAMAECGRSVAGQTPETLSLAICGRSVPELRVGPRAPKRVRLWNAAGYLRYTLAGPAELRRYEPLVRAFSIRPGNDAAETYARISEARPFLFDTVHMHLQSSAGSGALIGVIQGVLTKGAPPTAEDEAALVEMLADANGVESAELVSDLDRVASAIAAEPELRRRLAELSDEQALGWLRSGQSGRAGAAFERFLERHGHRSFREADLRQPSWADDPKPLLASIRTRVAHPERPARVPGPRGRKPEARLRGRVPEALLRYARSTVRNRERSKSMMIEVVDHFKRAYRALASQLVDEGLLADEDRIYFLTHSEIGRLLAGLQPGLEGKALRRKRAYERQAGLELPELSIGTPEPSEPTAADLSDGALQGRPASHGVVEGRARVVRTVAEAAALQPGEILVAPVTDVGWTPYFALIGGLATDVGSPISHGAVVAREYGLPAVVNLRVATHTFRTGDLVVLDGTRGTLRRLEN